jgi:hypothetical protein
VAIHGSSLSGHTHHLVARQSPEGRIGVRTGWLRAEAGKVGCLAIVERPVDLNLAGRTPLVNERVTS